jgi:DNA-binding Lrp family transcriptional regulator
MDLLIRDQPETLFEIVNLIKEKRKFPTIGELAKKMKLSYDATRGRVSRLRNKNYIKKIGTKFQINKNLLTEKEPIKVVLLCHELTKQKNEKRLSKEELCKIARNDEKIKINEEKHITDIIKKAIETKYIEEIVGTDEIRTSEYIINQLKYLKLIIGR